MHSDFNKKHPNAACSYDVYRNVVREVNISFTKLGHEQCEVCEIFKQHEHTKETLQPHCKTCVYTSYVEKAKKSREEYRKDADLNRNENDLCFSADLQKVIMLPRMEQFKIAIFTTKVVIFDGSFVPVGKKQKFVKPLAAIWHEGTAGRKKEEIVSSFHAFFLKIEMLLKLHCGLAIAPVKIKIGAALPTLFT